MDGNTVVSRKKILFACLFVTNEDKKASPTADFSGYEQKRLHEIRVNQNFGCSVIKTRVIKISGFSTWGQLTPVLSQK